jgi:hypothetical protein
MVKRRLSEPKLMLSTVLVSLGFSYMLGFDAFEVCTTLLRWVELQEKHSTRSRRGRGPELESNHLTLTRQVDEEADFMY